MSTHMRAVDWTNQVAPPRIPAFTPPETLDVRDARGGFTALTPISRRGYWARSQNTLWRPGNVAKHGTTGTLAPTTVRTDDFYQTSEPVVSAEYRLPHYSYRVKVWWHSTGERIA